MKKQGLLKRIALGLTAGAMIVTMLPSTLAAAETTDGSYWKHITNFNLSGFPDMADPASDRWNSKDTMKSEKTLGDDTYTVYVDAGAGPIGNNTGFIKRSWIDDPNNSEHYLAERIDSITNVNEKILRLRRTWVSGSGWSTPKMGVRFKNIFGSNQINEGDRIRITAYVYLTGTEWWVNSSGKDPDGTTYPQEDTATVRMWLSQKDTDGSRFYDENPIGMQGKFDGSYTYQTVTKGAWTPVTLEYTANSVSKDVKCIKIDNVAKASDNATEDGVSVPAFSYPTNMFITGIRVENLSSASGTYTIDDAGKVTGSVNAGINEMPSEDAKAKVIVVAYQDTTFLGCSINDYTEGGSYNFTIDNVKGANDIKAYIWYMNNTEPKIKPLTLTLQ